MLKSRTYDIELAVKFGLNNAIFLQDLAYWIDFNKSRDTAYRDGKYWTYGTMDSIVQRHPYWTKNQVKYIIDTCRKNGWIQVEQYDKSNYNRTNWYTISDDVWDILCIKDLPVDEEKFSHREETVQTSNNINIDDNKIPKNNNKNNNYNVQKTGSTKSQAKYQPEWFDRFWVSYPKRKGRADAIKAWDKLKPNDELFKIILNSIAKQRLSKQWLDDEQFIPLPATWLRGCRWEDEVKEVSIPDDIFM